MKATSFRNLVLSGFFGMLVAAQAQATVVTGVTVQSFSGQFTPDNRLAVDTINGRGLDPGASNVLTALHNGVPGETSDDGSGGANQNGMWLAGTSGGTANIVYNLGAVYTIDTLYVWNYAEEQHNAPANRNRGAQSVDVYADNSTTPTTLIQNFTFSIAADISGGTFGGPNNFITSYGVPAVAYTFSSPITAQYIKLDILSNYGGGGAGLSEIRFNAVPEPTAALLAVCGAVGLIRVRRRMLQSK